MKATASLIAASFALGVTSPVGAAPSAQPGGCARHAPEAAMRSGVPIDLILRVMRAESGDNPRALSPKGAMGCMQIMPGTWRTVSAHYNLGSEPFDARRNMIGGAMYLAELISRYGMSGAIPAYNAGPGRYERYIAGTASLPAETIAYTARIRGSASVQIAMARPPRWQEASLFLQRSSPIETPPSNGERWDDDVPDNSNRLFPLPTH
ncbi:hypothetical protein GCM10023219_20110 [Stakelama sediminis]|uniref:Soluble lytic murein transglycosylase-like protein n=1 Tax=Stakelama sediminis TaxID=463200 RepID=A0A840Z3M9_9SPHN|nr:lytic transglycosylase domain-containing protein [Stakelama sediminis]MBB5720320.1 soluble lytic murein transglycosylase-like protein [Stakelama sediminis]